MYLFWNNIHCLKYLKTSQFPSIYIYTNQARTFITCRMLIIFLPTIQARTFIKYRTLIFFNAKFRPGCLFGHPVYSLPKSNGLEVEYEDPKIPRSTEELWDQIGLVPRINLTKTPWLLKNVPSDSKRSWM